LRQMLPNGLCRPVMRRQPGASRIAGLCLPVIVWPTY
jgi:hypothetical protein